MNQIERNEILKKVGDILKFCHEIVSRLSSPPCCDQNTSEYVSMTSMSDIMTKTIISDCDSQYELSARSSSESSMPLQKWPTYYNITEVVEDSWMTETTMMDDEVMLRPAKMDNMLMHSLIKFLDVATPDAIYKPNWREEHVKKWIVPELLSVWTNAEDIFTDVKAGDDVKYAPPVIQYPSIDLHNVNTRFIENIPKPTLFPVHGVSSDPDFYHKLAHGEGEYSHKIFYRFNRHSPFGSDYGYDTNIGVIPPPTDPIHGYIWSKGSWKLFAVKPGEGGSSCRRRRG